METIFPREEKADLLFDKILKDPEACERLMQTFYGEIDSDLELVGGYLPPEQFAKALFDAYKNRDLTAFLMAVCKNSMFDLLRNSFLAPFRFNADGQVNPYLLTDEDGNLIQTKEIHVSEKDYNRFKKVFRKEKGVKMYLAYGYRKRHSYDADTMDVMDDVQTYIELFKENISYDHHMQYDGYGKRELYDELFQVICEVVCVKRSTIRVAGEEYPYELVKSRFLKLESSHLEYVIGCMQDTTTKITNIKAYMITALYNAPTTINHFYQQEVQHDMYGGGWHEKGIV